MINDNNNIDMNDNIKNKKIAIY